MLKALELIGFKSFAEKARFEFPAGITVVVGPNGSGKSNIVDAIKWVLGEQSVKSLRGKEMADVIFNGSGSRRPMNSAEITLTFDNSKKLFSVDTPSVHITRRVYRSGEGEYLINRQPSRLRDIRDLLAGTGLGTQAYSVIEQGKVDSMLQASSRDRRVIFEEAAGISRFKAKKIEALRRLERVELNLLRLSDIVDEVDGRLRSVRMQAGKARRYKEYSDRLQELRTQVGLVDWSRLSQRLAVFEEELATLDGQRGASLAEAEAIEARLLETDTQITDSDQAIHASEAQNSEHREKIAAGESTIEHERGRCRDLETEIARHRRQLTEMSARAGDFQQQLQSTVEDVEAAEDHHRRIARSLVESERATTELLAQIDQLRSRQQQQRTAHVDQMRSVAALGSEIARLESQVAAAKGARRQNQGRTELLDQQRRESETQLAQLARQRDELSHRVDQAADQRDAAKERLLSYRRQQATRQTELSQLQERHSRAAERSAILDELQKRHEGLSAGVKDVLDQARSAQSGPFLQVRGLVADLLHVSVESAPLVEVALGESAQLVVVVGRELLGLLQAETYRFKGRVGFVWIDDASQPPSPHGADSPAGQIDLSGRPGVLARADGFVESEPQYAPLVKRLLADTWIVEKLSHAVSLSQGAGRTQNFVTLAGQRLAADGTLAVGPNHTSTGLIARRSELRALAEQMTELEAKIRQGTLALEESDQQVDRLEAEVREKKTEHRQAAEALQQHSHKITAAEERHSQLQRQRDVLVAESEAALKQCNDAAAELDGAVARREQEDRQLADLEAGLGDLTQQTDLLDSQLQSRRQNTTDTKVELAKSEERLGSLRGRMRQVEESRQERQRAIEEARERLADCSLRAREAQWGILRRESEIAELYLKKESFAAQVVELINQRESLRAMRSEFTARAQKCRSKARKLEEKSHTKQLEASEIRHERATLADRLREDYGIDLAQLEHEPTGEEQHQREAVQEEIDDLRRKIGNLGNVNVEALEELESLEQRHGTLASQYNDLTSAKTSLERIIERINTDSRRLFTETLETVRGHFQGLFRDLFGGGRADIVLEEGVDILETGVEILARPPGKEPRSISLLSGGEKTLTCVAMLLALFRSRPSPFCVLDEVDAALDEANIDRFTKVLQDFLGWTQFIIVTHSKKTMTCANTIYGVTMQESGVSKQVSVRFEDVSEDGQILVDPNADEDSSDEETQAA